MPISNIAIICTTITKIIKGIKLPKKQAICHSYSGKIAVMNQSAETLGGFKLVCLVLKNM